MRKTNIPAPQPNVSVETLLLQVIQLLQAQQQQSASVSVETSQPVSPGKETMTVAETAEYLRVSEWTVYDLVRQDKLPYFRVKSRIFTRRREIERWIAEGACENYGEAK